jgi:hypothetical protein
MRSNMFCAKCLLFQENMAYPSTKAIIDACYDKVTHINYLEDKWSVLLGLKNHRHAQLCLWTHSNEDGWAETGRIDCLRRNLSNGVCEVLVTTTEEVTVWQLHKSKLAMDRVICYVNRDVKDICERLNCADEDAVAEYMNEFIDSSHDLRKLANSLKKFLWREYPGKSGPLESQPTQGGAGGSKKHDRSPPSKQVSDSQRKSLLSSQSAQASGSSRGTASQSRS